MRYFRVELVWKHPDGSTHDKIYVDLLVDEEFVPHRQMTFLGWVRSGADEYHPFRIIQNDRMDYGSAWDDANRWGKTNIRSKKTLIGEYATFDIDGEEWTYKVAALKELTALEQRSPAATS